MLILLHFVSIHMFLYSISVILFFDVFKNMKSFIQCMFVSKISISSSVANPNVELWHLLGFKTLFHSFSSFAFYLLKTTIFCLHKDERAVACLIYNRIVLYDTKAWVLFYVYFAYVSKNMKIQTYGESLQKMIQILNCIKIWSRIR